MRIKWGNIIILALLIIGAVLAINLLPPLVDYAKNIRLVRSTTWSVESVVIVLVGFLLITYLASLRIRNRSKRQDRDCDYRDYPYE